MKKFLLIFIISNVFLITNAMALDCTDACRKNQGVRDLCLQPVPAGNAPVYERDITGSLGTGSGPFLYCDCRCGGYANGGTVRQIGPCSVGGCR